jgi:HEAT repeat protein
MAVLTGALGSEDKDVRAAAARALGATAAKEAVPVLVEALARPEPDAVVAGIVEALARIRDPRALPALVAKAAEIDPGKRDFPIVASIPDYPAASAVEALEAILAGAAHSEVKMRAVAALAKIPGARARAAFAAQFTSADWPLRLAAARNAGALVDRALLPALVELLRDPQAEVRSAARASIEEIRYYEEAKERAGEAAKATTSAVGEIVALLESDIAEVRLAAVKALERLALPVTLPALVRARKDADTRVREAVEAALDRFMAEQSEERR